MLAKGRSKPSACQVTRGLTPIQSLRAFPLAPSLLIAVCWCVDLCVCICVCVCVYLWCVSVCICVCVCVYLWCVSVWICVCVCVCVCLIV